MTIALDENQVWKIQDFKVRANPALRDRALKLAMDRDSVRVKDRDGRMRVLKANISKANVCPYKGSEIPDYESLGLDPNRIYMLLRDPDELAKAAHTFNGLQILRKHVPVNASDGQQDEVVGCTGTDAEFDGDYLSNSLSIWTDEAIDGVEDESQRELSSGYHYRADMTPGNFRGTAYDGVMRDIEGNHVALVKDGRAGPDVVVGDSNEGIAMDKTAAIANRTVSIIALQRYLKPKLAMDAKLPAGMMAKIFSGVTGSKFKAMTPEMAKRIGELTKPVLAKDASIDDVGKVLDMLSGHEVTADMEVTDPETTAIEAASSGLPAESTEKIAATDEHAGLRDFLKGKGMGEDDINTACSTLKQGATDEFPPKKDDDDDDDGGEEDDAKAKDADPMKNMVTKPAMDAALKKNAAEVRAEVRATERAIRNAEREVAPYVGALDMAFDSAEEVYRHALDILGVEGVKDIHMSALPTLLKMQRKAGAVAREDDGMALDAKAVADFNTRFPDAQRIQQA